MHYGMVGLVQGSPLVWLDLNNAGIHLLSPRKLLDLLPEKEEWPQGCSISVTCRDLGPLVSEKQKNFFGKNCRTIENI
jgi:hypothetical protein